MKLFYEEAARRDMRLRADRTEEAAMAFGGKSLAEWIKALRQPKPKRKKRSPRPAKPK